MGTRRETVKQLCRSVLTRLENQSAIQFAPRLRQVIGEELEGLVGPWILTDEDIKDKVVRQMGARAEALSETEFTETEQFRSAKSVIRNQVGENEVHGLYYQRPIKTVAEEMTRYWMRSSHIDDVFWSDDELEKEIVHILRGFDPKQMH